jgi:hypothetical protein|tara:strand:- start:311 stop:1462 length:1152 start_codon:yes stop_codon:yes gene_type:complete
MIKLFLLIGLPSLASSWRWSFPWQSEGSHKGNTQDHSTLMSSAFPRGRLSSLLYDAGVCDTARHFLARELIRLFAPDGCINGSSPRLPFVLAGWDQVDVIVAPQRLMPCLDVHIFEVDPRQGKQWPNDLKMFAPAERKRLQFHNVGLAGKPGTVHFSWKGGVDGKVAPAGSRLPEGRIFMVSADVQGAELTVLQGLDSVVRSHGIDVIIVEALGIFPTTPAVLDWLDTRGFVVFDFVGIRVCDSDLKYPLLQKCSVTARRHTETHEVMGNESYATSRPPGAVPFGDWWPWFHGVVGPGVQTDFLAVHRSVLTAAHVYGLQRMCFDANQADGISAKCPYLKFKTLPNEAKYQKRLPGSALPQFCGKNKNGKNKNRFMWQFDCDL